jgi:hypothetical protein
VTVNDTVATTLENNRIKGKLSCSGNHDGVSSSGNTTNGGKFGECTDNWTEAGGYTKRPGLLRAPGRGCAERSRLAYDWAHSP